MSIVWAVLLVVTLVGSAPPSATLEPRIRAEDVRSDTLSLQRCVALARERAPAVVIARRRQWAASMDSAATALNRRPELSLRAGAMVAPRGFYDPVITNLGEYEVKAALDWPLADAGGRARARARGALQLAAARSHASIETRDAGLQAAQLALRLLRLGEADAAQRQSLDWLAGLASLVRSGVASGTRSPTDSIRVALERDAVEAALEDTHLETLGATLELRAWLGLDGDGPLAIRETGEPPQSGPEPTDSLRLVATLEHQPELELARIAELESRLDLEEIRRLGAPSLDLSLDAGLMGADLTRLTPETLVLQDPQATFGDRLRQDLGASVSLHVRLPVLDRARPRRLRSRAGAQEASALESRATAAAGERRARMLLAEWRSASRRLNASQIVYERAERNLLKVKSLYSGGATTLLDLLDARRVFEEARDRRADARMAVRWARFQVEDRR